MRLPDAARVAFYYKDFFSAPLGTWTQATMRGPSTWSVSERELMAAAVAKWNSCAFCVGTHGAVAAKAMERPLVDAVLADFRSAPIPEVLKAALAFLETMTLRPTELSSPAHSSSSSRKALGGARVFGFFKGDERAEAFPVVDCFANSVKRKLKLLRGSFRRPVLRAHTTEELTDRQTTSLENQLLTPRVWPAHQEIVA